MSGRMGAPRALRQVNGHDVHPDNFGTFPPPGEYAGRIAHLFLGDDLVTLDIWLTNATPYVQVRFQFSGNSPHFAALVEGVPPASGRIFMGRGECYDFSSMRINFAIEAGPSVNGYLRAKLAGIALVPWPSSLGVSKAQLKPKATKGTE